MLALLEGSRSESEGKMDEAWNWYRAALRAEHHLRLNGGAHGRMQADSTAALVRDRLVAWAADPRTDEKLLRRALDSVIEFDARTPPMSHTLQVEYLAILRGLDDPDRLMREAERAASSSYFYSETRGFQRVYWFFLREPERSRRVVRLFFANWLAHCDRAPADRPKVVGDSSRYPLWLVYEPDPMTAASARALPPKELYEWLGTAPLAGRFLTANSFLVTQADGERQSRGVLIITLAEELYKRQIGRPPRSAGELLGSVLKVLPEGYQPSETAQAGGSAER
jgi:hypothetical protein